MAVTLAVPGAIALPPARLVEVPEVLASLTTTTFGLLDLNFTLSTKPWNRNAWPFTNLMVLPLSAFFTVIGVHVEGLPPMRPVAEPVGLGVGVAVAAMALGAMRAQAPTTAIVPERMALVFRMISPLVAESCNFDGTQTRDVPMMFLGKASLKT